MIAVAPINSDAPIVPRQGDIDSLMAHATTDLGQLPAYFGALDFEQLDTCWVAVISAAFFEAEDRGSLALLARSLVTVRERYRGRGIVEPPREFRHFPRVGPIASRVRARLAKVRVGEALFAQDLDFLDPLDRARFLRKAVRTMKDEFRYTKRPRPDAIGRKFTCACAVRLRPPQEAAA